MGREGREVVDDGGFLEYCARGGVDGAWWDMRVWYMTQPYDSIPICRHLPPLKLSAIMISDISACFFFFLLRFNILHYHNEKIKLF